MEVVDFSSNAKCLSASYIDSNNIDIASYTTKLEQGPIVHNTELFNGSKDCKIGGYTSLYLSNLKYGDEILSFKDPLYNTNNIITTDISFFDIDPIYLIINLPQVIDNNTTTTYDIIPYDQIDKTNSAYFEIEIVDNQYCRIYHKVNYDAFYLTVNSNFDIYFTNLRDQIPTGINSIDEYVFSFILDKENNRLALFKSVSGSFYNVAINDNRDLTLVKVTSASSVPFNSSNSFYINYSGRIKEIAPKLNTSWVSYDDINSLSINPDKSALKLKSNYLASTQYSYITGNEMVINILPLKNQLTKEGISQRGDYLLQLDENKFYPPTSLREYENIHIGTNSEKGVGELSFTYTFYNTEYVFKPDEYSVFIAPPSLYPYTRINVNDTLFALNGALGGDSPHSSDKIYTKTINGSYPNLGTYLCTWLSGGNKNTPGVWVDRYYNNTKITSIAALTSTSLKLYGISTSIEEGIADVTILDELFFDIKSDLTFEPSREYIYQRIGPNYINTFISHLDNKIIFDSLTARTLRGSIDIPTANTNRYNFDNVYHYNFIDSDVSSFTFSFWLETDWAKQFGYQLAGNYNNKGFGVFNDETITPFICIPYLDSLYVYNTNFDLINSIDFEGDIQSVIRTGPVDDIYVIINKIPEAGEETNNTNILYKLKSSGTCYDADIVSEIPQFINYCNTETEIVFLLNTTGDIAIYNILTEEITFSSVSIPIELGVNFDIRSIGLDRHNNVIGFRGEKSLPDNDGNHIFIIRNNLLVKESNDHTTRSILLSTSSTIYDFAIDEEDNMYVLHNKYLTKFSKQRDIIYKVLLDFNTNISIDIVREYVEGKVVQYPVVMSINSDEDVILSKIGSTGIVESKSELEGDIKAKFISTCDVFSRPYNYYSLTNFSLFGKRNFNRGNILKFRLKLPNKYNNRDNLNEVITIDISKFSIGKHHFAYRLDTIDGNISLFVDNEEVERITFDPAKYALENTMYGNFNVGAATFFNGSLLNNYIKQTDRYFCSNIAIEQPRLYNVAIDNIDIKFLNLLNNNIGSLVGSLPCGQRNQIEQIQTIYKWQIPGNKSNNINIRVKSPVVSNNINNSVLKGILQRDISKNLPVATTIKDIIIEQY